MEWPNVVYIECTLVQEATLTMVNHPTELDSNKQTTTYIACKYKNVQVLVRVIVY
jgi:hypothetical protein